MRLLLDHVDCPSACTSQMSLYFVLKCRSTKDDVAQENEYITKSQENEEKMSLAMSLTMSLANVAHKRPTQNHCHNPNKKAVHTYCLWGWYIKGKPGVKEINNEGGFLYLTQA